MRDDARWSVRLVLQELGAELRHKSESAAFVTAKAKVRAETVYIIHIFRSAERSSHKLRNTAP